MLSKVPIVQFNKALDSECDNIFCRIRKLLIGDLSEWLKEHAWKACIGETLSRVRIPQSPQLDLYVFRLYP